MTTGNDKSPIVLPGYVPEPRPATADRLIGAHYFPGWKPGKHYGWQVLREFPERKPILGWYDESNPEVTDWEIKWALEHGISFFVYCWYRRKENVPVTRDTLYLEHAIHDGLFQARYQDRFRFAIMWENQKRRPDAQSGVANEADLLENLLPFWMEQYFTKPNYLVVDGKPVLFVYHTEVMIQDLGGIDATRRAVEKMREACTRAGFDGLAIMGEHRGTNWQYLEDMKACGFDAAFAYCWHSAERFPTIEAAFDQQIEKMKAWADKSILPFPPTATVGWDPMPWSRTDGRAPWLHPDKITRWYSKPEEFIHLLQRVKEFTDAFPANSLTQRMLLLDNWNEWGEGHFLSPHAAAGFGYLQAVRDVFTARDNLPDYRTPQMLGLGPYGPDTI